MKGSEWNEEETQTQQTGCSLGSLHFPIKSGFVQGSSVIETTSLGVREIKIEKVLRTN